jgi:hypothetical protein
MGFIEGSTDEYAFTKKSLLSLLPEISSRLNNKAMPDYGSIIGGWSGVNGGDSAGNIMDRLPHPGGTDEAKPGQYEGHPRPAKEYHGKEGGANGQTVVNNYSGMTVTTAEPVMDMFNRNQLLLAQRRQDRRSITPWRTNG